MRTIILLSTTMLLVAAEGDYKSSLRASLGSMPTAVDTSITAYNTSTGASATSSSSDDWDQGGRFSVAAFHNNGQPTAFNIGVGLAGTAFSFKGEGLKQELSEFGVAIEPGIAFNLHPSFTLELGLPLGIGSASYTEDDSVAGTTFKATGGRYVEIGVVARPVWKIDRLQLFAEVGWLDNHAYFDRAKVQGLPNVEAKFDLDSQGAFYALGAGIAF